MPLIIGLDHVQLAMPPGGEDAARAFYGELLGLPEVLKPPVLAARGGCWFENEAVKLHLGVDAKFCAAQKAHPALLVSDLTALAARLAAAGHRLSPDPAHPGLPRGYIDDPFGNRIELIEA